jgi:VCBS repeat-containing protein
MCLVADDCYGGGVVQHKAGLITPLPVSSPGVLGNDTDPDSGDSLRSALVTGPAHGPLTLSTDGSFTYTPAANYNGPDSLTYKASDGTADSAPAKVSITVNSVNDAPTVAVASGDSCSPNATRGTINLTVADEETAVESLTLKAITSNAAVVPASGITFTTLAGTGADRTLTVIPTGRAGRADLTVTVSDGEGAMGTVIVTVIVDANGSRTTNGTAGTDMIFGQNGDDTLNGLDGNDLLCGGRGNDNLTGGVTGVEDADHFGGGKCTDVVTDFTPSQGNTKDNTTEAP